ncbi:phosphoserine phosphatase SerB [Acinetobacter sp. MD2]|uniref:phosphoserine phosphatase SerB n=1 Tax=Acinetobacter sp. MD2 TaxID=2600066 RepID=UPI002D1F2759|nr:phosphoserine phosphatase SerB [Acinetobacter sp. MD2]MEB3768304.1 phosphoserine phosphatase SerB [Acinetobacter sp. MD2]
MREITLISFLGSDQPNLVHRLVQILSHHSLHILDMRQAVVYDQLSLGIVVTAENATHIELAMKELLILAHEIDLTVRLQPICNAEDAAWQEKFAASNYVVTGLAPKLNGTQLHALTQAVAAQGLKIDQIRCLSESFASNAAQSPACIELKVTGQVVDLAELRQAYLALGNQFGLDISIQDNDIYRSQRRLICFDMDSTLIGQEVIDELAREAGVGEQVAEITERAMQGELDFQQSFRARVALLKGLDAHVLPQIAERLTINEGAERLISTLKALGYHTAIFSGGFQYFAEYLQQKLGIDEVHANQLDVCDGKVTGEVTGQIVDAARKAELLQSLAHKLDISLAQTVAVGDGANDLAMLAKAGLGVAYKAKPLVRQTAEHAIAQVGLDGVLYLLGLSDQEIQTLAR